MKQWQPRANRFSRRALLAAAGSVSSLVAAPPRTSVLSADWSRFDDPSTEFGVQRLTSPAYSSYLPARPGRAAARNAQFVILASDRSGSMQLQQLDLKSGQSRVLAPISHQRAFTLSVDDRIVYFQDQESLFTVSLVGVPRVTRLSDAAHPLDSSPLCVSEDGTSLWFTAKAGDSVGLMKLRLGTKAEPTVVAKQAEINEPIPNPRRGLVLWRSTGDTVWLCEHDGANLRRMEMPAGRVRQAIWSPEGQSVLYLHEPAVEGGSAAIREQDVDSHADRLVAKTSQYACFARNANATVFVGASRSKAGPYLLLMLRLTRRELALCEHRSVDAFACSLAFSPDSQRLFFQGDKEGKSVVYSMKLDRLVEKTDL